MSSRLVVSPLQAAALWALELDKRAHEKPKF